MKYTPNSKYFMLIDRETTKKDSRMLLASSFNWLLPITSHLYYII